MRLAIDAIRAGRSLVLVGDAGVGKTRMARELVAQVGGSRRSEWIAATQSAATVPLGAAAHLVPPIAADTDRDTALRAIVASFRERDGDQPTVLGVDDAHLLDAATATLVHQLVTSASAVVVATARRGDDVPDAITSLWKDAGGMLLAIQPLARSEVETLVGEALGGPLDAVLTQTMWQMSNGNALYVRELLRHGIETEALRHVGGVWRWVGPLQVGERLHGLITTGMGRLDDDERAVLEIVAIGEPFPAAALADAGVADAADRLERRGLLTPQGSGTSLTMRLGHPLFGEVARAAMTARRAGEVQLAVADALGRSATSPSDRLRVVLLEVEAGARPAVDDLRRAARQAWVLWAAPVAERLARVALEDGPDLEAGYLLGEALSDQGRSEEALDAWAAAAPCDGPDSIHAALAVATAAQISYHFGRPADALAVLRTASARVTDVAARQHIEGALALIGQTRLEDGAPADAAPNVVLAVVLRDATGGRLHAARAAAADALAGSATWGREQPTVELLLRLADMWSAMLAGDVTSALELVAAADAHAIAARLDVPRVGWCLSRGIGEVLRGRPTAAVAALSEGVALMGAEDRGWLLPLHAHLAIAHAQSGNAPLARECLRVADVSGRGADGVWGVDAARAAAWASASAGEIDSAVALAVEAADLAATRSQPALELFALHDAARFGHGSLVAGRLGEVAVAVDGALAPALADHVAADTARDAPALLRAADAFAAMQLNLLAAEAATSAANVFAGQGRKASAFAARERAAALVGLCDGARTPGLRVQSGPDELTGREREVATLAASGLASRDIAIRLDISPRTVDNLLGRVYVKLGIDGRAQLREVMPQHGRE